MISIKNNLYMITNINKIIYLIYLSNNISLYKIKDKIKNRGENNKKKTNNTKY